MSGPRMFRRARTGHWAPSRTVTLTMLHSAPCRVCGRTLANGDYALHKTWGIEYACVTCGYHTLDELSKSTAWLAAMGKEPMTEIRARWLEVHGYATVDYDNLKLAWTDTGRARRDEWRRLQGAA